jgi:hypothetical protein
LRNIFCNINKLTPAPSLLWLEQTQNESILDMTFYESTFRATMAAKSISNFIITEPLCTS